LAETDPPDNDIPESVAAPRAMSVLSDEAFLTHVAEALGRLPGVAAVMLGGSRAFPPISW
jgi:hypothetical protein